METKGRDKRGLQTFVLILKFFVRLLKGICHFLCERFYHFQLQRLMTLLCRSQAQLDSQLLSISLEERSCLGQYVPAFIHVGEGGGFINVTIKDLPVQWRGKAVEVGPGEEAVISCHTQQESSLRMRNTQFWSTSFCYLDTYLESWKLKKYQEGLCVFHLFLPMIPFLPSYGTASDPFYRAF